MNLKLLFSILRSSWLLIVLTPIVTVVTAVIVTDMQPRVWLARASLIVNFQEENPFESSVLPAQLSGSYMATQLDIIRSEKVALDVVDNLDLTDDRDLVSSLMPDDAVITGDSRQWLATRLQQNLDVSLAQDNSRVVAIGVRATDPEASATISNAYADAYMRASLELNREPVRRNAEWFDEQTEVLRQRLEAAEARLTEFQQENGIVAIDEALDTETARLAELSTNLVEAQSDLYDVQSRQLGVNHPEYKRAVERERSIRRSVDEQKARILELRDQRDRLGALAREVENEKLNYETTLQSYYQASLESQFNQTNISVLSPAVPPRTPDSPNLILNVLSALLLGLALPIALAVFFEMINRRVRTVEDVNEGLGIKVLESV